MTLARARLVVIDDERNAADALGALLHDDGYEVAVGYDAETALRLLEAQEPDLVLTDLRLPGLDGLELLGRIRQMHPSTMVIVMTAYGTVKNAVKAMKLGAEDYLSKPVDVEELELVVSRALEKKSLLAEANVLRQRLEQKYRFDNLVGESPPMLEVLKSVRQIAPSNASVLLLGESGTGKELFAQAIHENSPRKRRPFVKVACAALPETLLESELFGHEKGLVHGRDRGPRRPLRAGGRRHPLPRRDRRDHPDRAGEAAPLPRRSTSSSASAATRPCKVDVRMVAATNRDLEARIREGRFREDLFYRLNVIELHIPPCATAAATSPSSPTTS